MSRKVYESATPVPPPKPVEATQYNIQMAIANAATRVVEELNLKVPVTLTMRVTVLPFRYHTNFSVEADDV